MDPREFHVLASGLVSGDRPSELRSAISRAYYAAYNVSVEVLEGMGFRISKGPGGHGEVLDRLTNSQDDDLRTVSSKLKDLRTVRNHADYDMAKSYVERKKNAKARVEDAERVISKLEACCLGSRRQQVIDAIKDWQQRVRRS